MSDVFDKPVYAVYCPKSFEYFLTQDDWDGDTPIESPLSGGLIAPEDVRRVQLATDDMVVFDPDALQMLTEEIGDDITAYWEAPLKTLDPGPAAALGALATAHDTSVAYLQETLEPEAFEAARIGADLEYQREKDEFMEGYFEAHSVTYGVIDDTVLVFDVGHNPSALIAMPIANVLPSIKQTAKTVGLLAGILIETFILLGIFLGVKGRPSKSAKAVEEFLANSERCKRLLEMVTKVKNGSWTVMTFALELLKYLGNTTLRGQPAVQVLLLAFFAGVFSLAGILWAVSSLLVKLAAPWLAALLTGAKAVACIAGIITKIASL